MPLGLNAQAGSSLKHLTDMLVCQGTKVFDELGGGIRYTSKLVIRKHIYNGIHNVGVH